MLSCTHNFYLQRPMSLSRLTPRNSRKAVSLLRKSRTSQTDTSRHLNLLEAIRSTRDELDQWKLQIDQVEGLFSQFVIPREKTLTEAVANVTKQLIHHFSTTELDIADRSLLGLWIAENLHSLQDHPFSSTRRIRALTDDWRKLINVDGVVENQLSKLARRSNERTDRCEQSQSNQGTNQDSSQSSNQGSVYGKTDKKHTDDTDKCTANNENKDKSVVDEQFIDEKVLELENKLSVERLFRQLAKALHPDKEQDETLRVEKHILMSQCLEARKKKDINTLLCLYCEHIGDLPDDLNDNSHDELIVALEAQLKRLQTELRQQRFGDPLRAMIVERYSSPNAGECEKRINDHAASLDFETDAMNRLYRQLDTQDGLLDSLDDRRAIEQDRLAINEMTGVSDGYY